MMYPFHWLDPRWRTEHGFAPFWLPRVPSPTDIREWAVEVDPPGTLLNQPLPLNGVLHVSLHRLLIETGIALTPATSTWDPRAWFALYRYGLDFAGTTPALRFYAGVQEKDPRLTAVASEEIATGITCYLLREHFGLDHITDAYACLQRGELVYVNPTSQIRPDYFCEDKNGETVLAESKGATGTRCAIESRIDPEGWSQVQNVRPVNLPLRSTCGRVVIGTHFCVQGMHARSETTTIIKDPDGVASLDANHESDALMRLAYAKVLRFTGHDLLAERLLGIQVESYIQPDDVGRWPSIRGIRVLPLCQMPFGGLVCLHAGIAKPLLFLALGEMREHVRRSLGQFRETRRELEGVGYALPNGVVIVYDERSFDVSER